jgi:hypothetical protein
MPQGVKVQFAVIGFCMVEKTAFLSFFVLRRIVFSFFKPSRPGFFKVCPKHLDDTASMGHVENCCLRRFVLCKLFQQGGSDPILFGPLVALYQFNIAFMAIIVSLSVAGMLGKLFSRSINGGLITVATGCGGVNPVFAIGRYERAVPLRRPCR